MSQFKKTQAQIASINADIEKGKAFLLTSGIPDVALKATRESVEKWEKELTKLQRIVDKNLSGRRLELVNEMIDLLKPKVNGVYRKLSAENKLLLDGKTLTIVFTPIEGSIETFGMSCSGTRKSSGKPSTASQQTAPSTGIYVVDDIEIDTYEESRGKRHLFCSRPVGRKRVPLDIGVIDSAMADGEEVRFKTFKDVCETYGFTVAAGSAHRIAQQGFLSLMVADEKRSITYKWISRK